ncbi:hypothetical protein RhiirA4_429329 [Rhizophagus irregularis]|uniref:Uncharacterized protein n=1 Tax=Rhizophagus irregularis TaxID=588596 RepID=A0A2I1HGA0_9GLOM|nr:hypothetical protein RhiirA4_429329 [Rhizophagus irregularis]
MVPVLLIRGQEKQELISYESERDRLLHLLSEVNEKINITKAELTRFSSLDQKFSLVSEVICIRIYINQSPNGDPSGDTEMNTEDSISSDNDSSRKKNRHNLARVNYNCGSPPRKRRKTRPFCQIYGVPFGQKVPKFHFL